MNKCILVFIIVLTAVPVWAMGVFSGPGNSNIKQSGFYISGKHYNTYEEFENEQAKTILTTLKLPWFKKNTLEDNMSFAGSGVLDGRRYVDIKVLNTNGLIKDVGGQKAAYEIGHYIVDCERKIFGLEYTKVYDKNDVYLATFYLGPLAPAALNMYDFSPKSASFGNALAVYACKPN